MTNQLFVAAACALVLGMAAPLVATPANAADYKIEMLNNTKHGMFQFEPNFLKINPGDTVTFVAKDKGHDAQTIAGMLPEGATPFKGAMNKDVTVTFTKEGVYGVKCLPHYGMGMVALIEVGNPNSNLKQAEAVSQPGKAKAEFKALFAEVK